MILAFLSIALNIGAVVGRRINLIHLHKNLNIN